MQQSSGIHGSDSGHLSSVETAQSANQELENDSHAIRVVNDSRLLRGPGFVVHLHDEGGETEGDQDGEDGMDDSEQHENDLDAGEADERTHQRAGGVAGQEAMVIEGAEQESDMELDLLAESESDSDDNTSNINDAASSVAQRSIQTHATAGSDPGGGVANLALFSEDDSDDSTQQEDEDDEEDESDGNESDDRDTAVAGGAAGTAGTSGTSAAPGNANNANTAAATGAAAAANAAANADDFNIVNDDQLFERRPAAGAQRGNLAPLSMQWAIRSRDPPTIRSSTASGLVFIDHTSGTMRRSAASSAVAAAAAAAASNQESVTMATTASGLARAFGIIMR